jgi:hypothetical protein
MIFTFWVTITTYTAALKKGKDRKVSVNRELQFVEISFSGKVKLSL